MLRACCTNLLRSATCLMPGARLASFPGLRSPHAHTHRFWQACSPCTWKGCSYVLRRRTRKGAPAAEPAAQSLPPPRLPTLVAISCAAAPRPRMVQPLITRALRPGHALPAPLARMYRCTRKDSPQPAPAPAQHAPSQLDHFLTRRPSSPDRCVTAILKPRRPPSPTPSGPTPLCPTPPPAATRPLLSRGTHPARGPRPPVRATAFSFLSPPSLS